MSKKKHLIFFLIAIIILIIVVSFWLVFLPIDSLSEEEVVFNVERGEGSKKIALNLEKENLIRWAPCFRLYVLIKGTARNLKTGEYLLSPSMNTPEIAEKFFKEDVIKEKITIIEGWSLREIGFYFEERGFFEKEEFEEIANQDFSDDFGFLKDKPRELSLEGYLFPDTYKIRKGESLEGVIKRMLENFDNKLSSALEEEIKEKEKTVFEIVTMASLIEKEVRTLEDKKLASGILWKRLEANMPLQVDATIAYILEGEKWSFDRARREIALNKEVDSPYNTYKYAGLPLGPISNPGLESIKAAIYSQESDYWYYLSTPEGDTVFSRTLKEHSAAQAKYFSR